jgi:ABC-type glycerol-3-phosphate transport system substrate-binding protein
MFKIIVISAGIIAAVLSVLVFSGKVSLGSGGAKAPTGQIEVWGTIPKDPMENFLMQYNAQAKTFRVTYRFIPEDGFSTALVEALAEGRGPDAIIAPYQKILEQASKVYPFPAASFTEKNYKDTYVNGASILWTPQGALALPVSIEPLVLFFNRTLLAKHGVVAPPKYWDEINGLVPTLTVINPQGAFVESAIALGAYNNVPNTKDILTTMVHQLGQETVVKQVNGAGSYVYTVTANTPVKEGGDIFPLAVDLRYFMEFSDPTKNKYAWNQFLPNAQDQFVAEKLAMYIGFYGDGKTIRERNQKLDFDSTYLPQTKDYNTFVTGMRLYGFATLRSVKNANVAFRVESDFASLDWSNQISALVGGVPAHTSYVKLQGVPEVLGRSNLVARGWFDVKPQSSSALFEQMIRDVSSGKTDVSDAVTEFVTRLQDKYTGQ